MNLTTLIILLNAIISYKAYEAFRDDDRTDRFLFRPFALSRGQNFPGVILSQFSHADFFHFLFNMMTLYFFGPTIEIIAGKFAFLVVYVLSGVTATLLPFYRFKNDFRYQALGASGCISGVLFAAIMLAPQMRISLMFIPIPIPGPVFAVLYLLFSYYFMQGENSRISHDAHIGGAIAGLILGGLYSPTGFMGFIKYFLHAFSVN